MDDAVTGAGRTVSDDDEPSLVLVTQVEFETLVARVEALEEALDALVSDDRPNR